MAERRVRHSLGRRVLGRSAAGRVTVTLSISRPGSDSVHGHPFIPQVQRGLLAR